MFPLHPVADPVTTEQERDRWVGQTMTALMVTVKRNKSAQWDAFMAGLRRAHLSRVATVATEIVENSDCR